MTSFRPLSALPDNVTDRGKVERIKLSGPGDSTEETEWIDVATQAELDAHTGDTTDAHDASAISFSAVGTIAATDVQTAVAEVATDAATALSTHAADTTSVHGITDTDALATIAKQDTKPATDGTVDLWWETDGPAFYVYDSTAVDFIEVGGGGGATNLDDLTDVAITAAAAGDIIRHNGTAWVDAVGTTYFEVAGAVATHEADTTSVHGIADTSTLYRSGGTDVAVADGGTGASTAAGARTNLAAQQTLSGLSLSDVGTPASGDLILLQDASDSNNLKVAQFSTFGGGGGGSSEPASFMAYHAEHSTVGGGYKTLNMGSANRALYYRILRGNCNMTKFRLFVGTSAGNVDLGIYRGTATAESPTGATKQVSTGSIACPGAGSATATIASTNVTWPTDWLAVSADGTTATCLAGDHSIASTGSDIATGLSYYENSAFPLPTSPTTTGLANWNALKITCTTT